ncbi:MFS transporter [Novacetimonas hansenii]|uniref:MFS transporter n=1 Tax=Novacetimonas hansenii TaxID=436 RepID=A0AAW5EQ52_NOVHA|nr:MFS transporter [Novacetimonas hansenii]MBL7236284.1 MFS transporter [Novacetimonas hansenii]MCJ8353859.1 MFS transporter [Novacetimonas hansenii]PYD72064.1 MFS transporter [Novacetimonas hansenii]QOF95124.1 MFS transporter [Novacetimonas hansenii]RFP05538.1 alpha-ketoglutarate transporter [Novacetimonas hansenii]
MKQTDILSQRTSFADKLGIPTPLFWGFVGLLFFMIGDGVEAGYLAPYLEEQGISGRDTALLFTIYGVTVSISSWVSGPLSDLWGPKRVMWIGLAIWAVFEVVFLSMGVATNSYSMMLAAYTMRGFGYPLFTYGFLVWIAAATPRHQLGSAAGWFWFAFSGGLPTLGSLFASFAIPVIGEMMTFWSSLVLVLFGGLLALLMTREPTGSRRLAAPGASAGTIFFSSVSILWREPKTFIAMIVRIIDTASEYAFLVIMPAFFTKVIGFSLSQWLQLLSIIFLANILVNLVSGMMADRLGHRSVVAIGGGVGAAVTVLLFYYVPLMFPGNFAIAAAMGALYGATVAAFVPLSGLMPQICPKEKAAALSALGLGAGASTWVGPAVVTWFESWHGIEGIIWIFSGLYLVSALLTITLTISPEARRYMDEAAARGDIAGELAAAEH